jgi:hypothetical protein
MPVVMLLLAISSAIAFVAAVFLMLPKRCDACGLSIKRGRCGYPDCDYYRKGNVS